MAKNYDNIVITSIQSDDYVADTRSIDLTGFSRRIFAVNTVDRLLWINTTNDFINYSNMQYSYPMIYTDVKYVRIKNIDVSNKLQIGLISGLSGATADMDSFEIIPGEMFILYDLDTFKFRPNEDVGTGVALSTTQRVNSITIGASSGTVRVDSYIGFDQS